MIKATPNYYRLSKMTSGSNCVQKDISLKPFLICLFIFIFSLTTIGQSSLSEEAIRFAASKAPNEIILKLHSGEAYPTFLNNLLIRWLYGRMQSASSS